MSTSLQILARTFLLASVLIGVSDKTACAQVKPETSTFGKIAPPYATIYWRDAPNLDFTPLGNSTFLVSTLSGIQFWDANPNRFYAIPNWPPNHELRNAVWVRIEDKKTQSAGTLFATSDRTRFEAVRMGEGTEKLLWWSLNEKAVTATFPLPAGFEARTILNVGEGHALICGKRGAFILHADGTSLKRVNEAGQKSLRLLMERAGILGEVEGFSPIHDPRDQEGRPPPVRFDTKACKWTVTMSNPPDAASWLREGKDIDIKPYRLADGRWLIGHAEWIGTERWGYSTMKVLQKPFIWDGKSRTWTELDPMAGDVRTPLDQLMAFGLDDPLVSVDLASRRVEVFDTTTLSWQLYRQDLPVFEPAGVYLAPLDERGAILVFMRGSNDVFRLDNLIEPAPPGQLHLVHDKVSEIPLAKGGLMMVSGGKEFDPVNRPEVIVDGDTPTAYLVRPLPLTFHNPSGVELKDGSVLVFGGLPAGCVVGNLPGCLDKPAQSSFRWHPERNEWEEIADLAIPYAHGSEYDFYNGEWLARRDVRVRGNGDFVYLTNTETVPRSSSELFPLAYTPYRWSDGKPAVPLAPLRKGRRGVSLLELSDNRLAVIGGEAQRDIVALEKTCFDCPDSLVSIGPIQGAITTEILDEQSGRWTAGATSHFPGGQAVKLANGRIFKLSRKGPYSEDGYQAEISDATLTKWTKAPPFPIQDASVSQLSVVGDRALMLMSKPRDGVVIWNDDTQRWLVIKSWPGSVWTSYRFYYGLVSIHPAGEKRVLLRYTNKYEYATLPD